MPHYTFHVADGRHICAGGDRLDLSGDGSAREEANLIAYDLWSDPGEGDWNGWTVEVTTKKDGAWYLCQSVLGIPD